MKKKYIVSSFQLPPTVITQTYGKVFCDFSILKPASTSQRQITTLLHNYYCTNYLQLTIYVQNNIHMENQMFPLAALAIEKKGRKLRLVIQLFLDLCKQHRFL